MGEVLWGTIPHTQRETVCEIAWVGETDCVRKGSLLASPSSAAVALLED